METHGLIIGKFLPPHLGHSYLISTGHAQVDTLTVLICESETDPIPVRLREMWLHQSHPYITTHILNQDAFDRNDPHAWIEATQKLIIHKPDWVFSSEEYGILYAELLGCSHMMVDKDRVTIPCSGSTIRENPLQYLEYLEEPVAEYYRTQK